jgi:hypothetical protein
MTHLLEIILVDNNDEIIDFNGQFYEYIKNKIIYYMFENKNCPFSWKHIIPKNNTLNQYYDYYINEPNIDDDIIDKYTKMCVTFNENIIKKEIGNKIFFHKQFLEDNPICINTDWKILYYISKL